MSRGQRVNIYMSSNALRAIDEAARAAGESRSEYLTDAALTRARMYSPHHLTPGVRRRFAALLRDQLETLLNPPP